MNRRAVVDVWLHDIATHTDSRFTTALAASNGQPIGCVTILIEIRNTNRIWVVPLNGVKKPFRYFNSESNESDAKVSPNGQWIAYGSDASKRSEIYVETFPTPGRRWQVSADGG